MPALHAPYGPSRIPMFLRCPGSIQMSQKVPERRDSVAAAEGTVAHRVREMVLEFGFEPEDFIGMEMTVDGFDFEVDTDMVEYLRPGIQWVLDHPGRVINEYQVDLSRWMPGQFGTLDVGLLSAESITINDLKYGMGVPVDPVRHEPTMAYALGLWDNVARHDPATADCEDFLIVIDQPRNEAGGGEWWTTLTELLAFGEELSAGFNAAQAPDAPLVAGEKQCMFCPAKGICPEYARWSMEQFDMVLDDLDDEGPLTPADVSKFTSERRAKVAMNYSLLKKWLDSVHGQVLDDALCGLPTPGLKAVKGRRGARRWISEKRAEVKLRKLLGKDAIYSAPGLLSPTQVEALLPKEKHRDLELLWTQDEGRPSLTSEDSDKPAVNRADMLDDLD